MEFSDRPFGDLPGNHSFWLFEAKHVVDYIEKYLDNHSYAEKTLREHIRCNFSVDSVSKTADGLWTISGHNNKPNEPQETSVYTARKVIVASGFTSIPNIPHFQNDGFTGKIVHGNDFGPRANEILAPEPKKRVSVIGGGKSAADMVYATAKAGHEVNWIIRKNGTGPGLFAVPTKVAGYNNPTEVMCARVGTTLSPSHFGKPNWWTSFLHGTALGRWLLMKIFNFVAEDSFKHAGFETREKALEGFNKMKPDAESVFYTQFVSNILLISAQ